MTETEIKAREQAIEIVNSYHNILAKRIPDMIIVKYEAKQCALVAVDREIAAVDRLYELLQTAGQDNKVLQITYEALWSKLTEIRAEIEKL